MDSALNSILHTDETTHDIGTLALNARCMIALSEAVAHHDDELSFELYNNSLYIAELCGKRNKSSALPMQFYDEPNLINSFRDGQGLDSNPDYHFGIDNPWEYQTESEMYERP